MKTKWKVYFEESKYVELHDDSLTMGIILKMINSAEYIEIGDRILRVKDISQIIEVNK